MKVQTLRTKHDGLRISRSLRPCERGHHGRSGHSTFPWRPSCRRRSARAIKRLPWSIGRWRIRAARAVGGILDIRGYDKPLHSDVVRQGGGWDQTISPPNVCRVPRPVLLGRNRYRRKSRSGRLPISRRENARARRIPAESSQARCIGLVMPGTEVYTAPARQIEAPTGHAVVNDEAGYNRIAPIIYRASLDASVASL